jgi:hypothetical protein
MPEKEDVKVVEDVKTDDLKEEVSVPVSVLQELRDKNQELTDSLSSTNDQLSLYKANVNQGQPAKAAPAPAEEADFEDNDVLTYKDMKGIIQKLDNRYQNAYNELQVTTQNPDYSKTIKEYLPKVIENNPALKTAIMSSSDPYTLSYELAKAVKDKGSKKATKGEKEENMSDIDKILENAKKPGSASQHAGAGGGLTAGDVYAKMSDEEFEESVADILRRG